MRETLRKKLTAGGVAGALVLGAGALAGAATSGGSGDPVSRQGGNDSSGQVRETEVTEPTVGVTTPTLDDHGNDAVDDNDDDAVNDNDDAAVDDDNSGSGSIDDDHSGPGDGTDDAPGDDHGSGVHGSDY